MEHDYWGGGITGMQALAGAIFVLSAILGVVGLAWRTAHWAR